MEIEEIKELIEFMEVCNVIEYEDRKVKRERNVVNFDFCLDLTSYFAWSATPQGAVYWQNINEGRIQKNDYSNFID